MGYPHIRGTVVAAEWQPSFIHLWPGIGCPDFLRPFEDTPPPSAIVTLEHPYAHSGVAVGFFCALCATPLPWPSYSNPRDAIIRHCRYVVKHDAPHPQSPDRKISMTFIPEGDLYRLIVHSKLPSAEQFERWVFDEVLPTIRKHGAYLTKEKLWEVATSPEALMKLCSDLLAEREANISLRKENAQLEGKAAFYDLFIDLKHSTNLRTTAKELDVPERRFVRFLIERRFVYRTASGNVLPYANVKNAGLFCVKDYCNHGHTGSYTLVTPQGKLYFAQLREMILLVS